MNLNSIYKILGFHVYIYLLCIVTTLSSTPSPPLSTTPFSCFLLQQNSSRELSILAISMSVPPFVLPLPNRNWSWWDFQRPPYFQFQEPNFQLSYLTSWSLHPSGNTVFIQLPAHLFLLILLLPYWFLFIFFCWFLFFPLTFKYWSAQG